MNPFAAVPTLGFGSQFCLLLTWALVHFVWQGCLLAVGFAIVRRALAGSSANLRYAASLVTLVLMAACLPANLWLIEPAAINPAPLAAEQLGFAYETPSSVDGGEFDHTLRGGAIDRQSSAAVAPVEERGTLANGLQAAARWIAAALTSVSGYTAAAYALGLSLMLTRVFVGLAVGRRLRCASVPISEPAMLDVMRRHAARLALRAVPAVAWCSRISVPVAVGVLRPMILLPTSLATGLTGRQLEFVLLHELAHIQRYDLIANLLERLIEVILFFHPAVWWLTRQVRIERENACDDAVLRAGCQRAAYAEALLRVAELCAFAPSSKFSPAGLLAATGENPSQLARRIHRLFNVEEPATTRSAAPTVALLVLFAASVIIALAAWRSPAIAQVVQNRPPAVQQADPTETVAAAASADGRPADAQPANTQARVLHFPADRAMGVVSTRPASGDYATPVPEGGLIHVWQRPCVARGDVQVPAGVDVQLTVSNAASMDLSGLDRLAPDDVQFLNIRNSRVDNDGLRHVGHLSGLRYLNLMMTEITDEGVQHLAGLKQLHVVCFDNLIDNPAAHNRGPGIGDDALRVLAQMPELRRTTLRRMIKITDAGLAELAPLKHLSSLDLGGTSVTDAGLATLKQLPALVHLDLGAYKHGARITDAGLIEIGSLTNLTSLDLSGTAITDAGLAHLKSLFHLTILTLDETKITRAGLLELEPLQSLEYLRLPYSLSIDDVGAIHLAKLKSLRNFTGTLQITDRGLEPLATLPHLENLVLNSQQVTDFGIEHIVRLKALKSLRFHDCPITDAGLALLIELPNLESLHLSDTNVTGDGLACLAKAERLSHLDVDIDSRNELRHACRQIGKLVRLKSLRITGPATSGDLENLSRLPDLESLGIRARIDNLGAAKLAQLPSLKWLILDESTISDSGFEELSKLVKLELLHVDGYFTDQGLRSLGRLQSLQNLQVASPYVSQDAVDRLAADLPTLTRIQLSDNDPLKRQRRLDAEQQESKHQPAPNAPAAAGTGADAAPANAPTEPVGEENLAGQNIVEILVVGNGTRATEQILNSIRARADQPFDQKMLEEDVRTLAAKKWFLDVRPVVEPVDGGLRLTFEVVERPTLLYVKYLGNTKIKDKRLAKEVELKRGSPLDPDAVEAGRHKIEEFYKSKGYKDARVEIVEGAKPGDHGAIYKIDEGEPQKAERPQFTGSIITPGLRLKTVIESKPPIVGLFKGQYNEDKVNEDIDKLIAYYRGLGFFRVRVSRQLSNAEEGERPELAFTIDEGPRYRVSNIRFNGNQKLTAEQLSAGVQLKEGDVCTRRSLDADLKRLLDLYSAAGYRFANIQPELEFDDEASTVTVIFSIKEADYFGSAFGIAR